MDSYRPIIEYVDGRMVATMVKGVCAGYYLADDVDKRINSLMRLFQELKAQIADMEQMDYPCKKCEALRKAGSQLRATIDRVREIPDFVENQSELMEAGDTPEWEYVVYLIRKALEGVKGE